MTELFKYFKKHIVLFKHNQENANNIRIFLGNESSFRYFKGYALHKIFVILMRVYICFIQTVLAVSMSKWSIELQGYYNPNPILFISFIRHHFIY